MDVRNFFCFVTKKTMPYGGPYGIPRKTTTRRKAYLGGVVQRRRKAVATSRLKLAKPVRALVDRRIDRQIETKCQPYHFRRTQWDNLPDVQARCCQILANIGQGDERNDRHGSKIKLTSLSLKGYIQIPSYESPGSEDRSNIMFRLCVLSAKSEHFFPDVLANWAGPGNFFSQLMKPASEATPVFGDNSDMWKDINRDLFTVHYDKVFDFSRGDANGQNISPVQTNWRPDKIKFFNVKLKCKNKVLRFADATDPGTNDGINPSNYAPFLVGWWSYINGAAPSNTPVPYIEYYAKSYFKDA